MLTSMGLFDIWNEFGFSENPYSQVTLRSDELGDRLLAGRDLEVKLLQRRIGDTGAHPAVEGPIGAGKTSMINVAVYRMQQRCLEARAEQLYLPAVGEFQPGDDASSFQRLFYYNLAQTIIKNVEKFAYVGLPEPDVRLLDKWLNKFQYTGWNGGVQVLGSGPQGGHSSEPNTGDGVTESGFQQNVRDLLTHCFPPGSGGIVCILDNLEILETPGDARKTLDELRDKVFNLPQVRWVLSGSRGIVSRAKTERLSGMMTAPMLLEPINDLAAVDAIERRIKEYGTEVALVPVSPDAFDFLYLTLNKNLRESLTKAGEFSHWLYDEYVDTDGYPEDAELTPLLHHWLMEKAEYAAQDAKGVRPRNWQFFDSLCAFGGRAGSGEWATFDFAQQQGMTGAVTELVDANLMSRETDPDNGQKTVNSVTSTGWLVYFFRTNFEQAEVP